MASDRTYELVDKALNQLLTQIADSEPDPWMALAEATMRICARGMDADWERRNGKSLERVAERWRDPNRKK